VGVVLGTVILGVQALNLGHHPHRSPVAIAVWEIAHCYYPDRWKVKDPVAAVLVAGSVLRTATRADSAFVASPRFATGLGVVLAFAPLVVSLLLPGQILSY
jgi:hypothetical protein